MKKWTAVVCYLLKLKIQDYRALSQEWDGKPTSLKRYLLETRGKAPSLDGVLERAHSMLKECDAYGLLVLHPGSTHYPPNFLEIHEPPVFLTYRGDQKLLEEVGLSIVGSRHPIPWVERWMEGELIPYAKQEKSLFVSGGAIGIDQWAHRCALRGGGKTLGILPSGIEACYPKNLKSFFSYVSQGRMGLLSEYPPNEVMKTFHFYRRNRLISAFSNNLFVVQAHQKSGTMITAKYGVEQNKNILALASDPVEPRTLGNLQLLYDGAQMVRWASDLPKSL